MRLLDYLRDGKLDDDAFAERLGECSGHAVKKWKYGEREPDAATMLKIERATEGKVTFRDWAEQSAERAGRRRAPAPDGNSDVPRPTPSTPEVAA